MLNTILQAIRNVLWSVVMRLIRIITAQTA